MYTSGEECCGSLHGYIAYIILALVISKWENASMPGLTVCFYSLPFNF